MRTERQRRGALAEVDAVLHLEQLGWHVVGRNLRVARDEIDILAVDPGPPPALVVVEVRSLRSSAFGAPEERVDRVKVRRLYRALFALRSAVPLERAVQDLPGRVDLLVVDRRSGRTDIRHLKALEPP